MCALILEIRRGEYTDPIIVAWMWNMEIYSYPSRIFTLCLQRHVKKKIIFAASKISATGK
jgi:hypothetical protein